MSDLIHLATADGEIVDLHWPSRNGPPKPDRFFTERDARKFRLHSGRSVYELIQNDDECRWVPTRMIIGKPYSEALHLLERMRLIPRIKEPGTGYFSDLPLSDPPIPEIKKQESVPERALPVPKEHVPEPINYATGLPVPDLGVPVPESVPWSFYILILIGTICLLLLLNKI